MDVVHPSRRAAVLNRLPEYDKALATAHKGKLMKVPHSLTSSVNSHHSCRRVCFLPDDGPGCRDQERA